MTMFEFTPMKKDFEVCKFKTTILSQTLYCFDITQYQWLQWIDGIFLAVGRKVSRKGFYNTLKIK